MPVPRMPLDLVAYIADFVEYSFSPIDPSASKVTRRTGEALSLVCRSWTRIGRDLRWRTLVLRPSSFASLLEHLTAHPHLAPHVQNIRQAGSIRTVHLDGLSLFVERSPGIAQIDALVSLLAVARWTTRLAFAKDKTEAEQFPQILQAASRLPLLQIFDISSIDYLDWDDDCASAWLDGFPSITDINLDFGPLEDSSSRALHQGDRPLKKLRALWLKWSLETEEEQETWATSFLSTLDPSSLLECEILDDAVSSATWSWLGRCEFLTKLHIATRLDQSEEILTELFRLFPRIQGLRSLDIADYDTDEGDSIEVDLALEQMLASCPPSLSWICVKHILFRDCEAIPEIDEGLWEDQEHLAGRGFVRKTEEEYAFWPLRKDRAGQWFRVIEEDDDEDEGASIDNDGGNGRDPDDDQADNAGDKDADEEDDNRQGSIETSRDAAGDDAQGAIRAQVEERDGSARAEM